MKKNTKNIECIDPQEFLKANTCKVIHKKLELENRRLIRNLWFCVKLIYLIIL